MKEILVGLLKIVQTLRMLITGTGKRNGRDQQSLDLSPFRTEKDASGWSKDKLERLLVGLKFDGDKGSCFFMYFT